jgi:UDP-glucose 4-epimerase
VACEAAAGRRRQVAVYGTDYPTPDGTGIRDYIHVEDLADAHLRALDYLREGGKSAILNCGYGHGYSVREVLDMVQKVAGKRLDIVDAPRRPGDPPALAADAGLITATLGWKPRYDDLEFIVRTALEWERKLAAGTAFAATHETLTSH